MKPNLFSLRAARALVASGGQVQYNCHRAE